jgi:hypothetical protein
LILSRQLEDFGLPLIAGGYVDQPLGYLQDVGRVRTYLRAIDLMDLQREVDGALVNPAPPWAFRLTQAVAEATAAARAGDAG